MLLIKVIIIRYFKIIRAIKKHIYKTIFILTLIKRIGKIIVDDK